MPSLARRLALERCRLQGRQVLTECIAAGLFIALVLLLLGSAVPQYDQFVWAGCFALCQTARIQCARRHLPRRLASAQACFGLTAAFSGLLVGAPISLFAHLLSMQHLLALGLICIGWLAITVGMHTAFRAQALLHSACILVQIAVAWVQTPLPAPELGLPALAVYAFLLTRLGEKSYSALRDSVTQSSERRQLVRKLTQAIRSARQAHDTARKFLACASHDLRQPASALGLLTTVLRERCTDPAITPLVQGIERSSHAMGELLDSLLNLSRLDAGVIEPRPQWLSVEAMIAELRLEFDARASEKGLSLRFSSDGGSLLCDPVLLGRCLRNLLDNAIRYTPSGSISIVAQPTQHGFMFRVSDSGIGIAPELHQRVFEDHYQVERASHEGVRGLGLGLAIVKRLASLMSAEVQVQSDGQSGSCFTLRFAAEHYRPQSGSDHSPPQVESASQQAHTIEACLPRILLVEDDAELARAMTLLLRSRADRIDHVFSVEGALHRLRTRQFNLLITDLHLPGSIDGLHLVEHARQIHPGIKCLLATGDTSLPTHERARRAGVTLAIKPLSAHALDQALLLLLNDTEPI
jgi:signal transduction histidine kinase/CheY-like chemotaxis protein